MSTHIVLTFMAPDKPGLIDRIAGVVSSNRGNWLESRLAHMAGQFTGIVRIVVGKDHAEPLCAALTALQGEGFKISLESVQPEESEHHGVTQQVDVVGIDRPGIVKELSASLARHHINVTRMASDVRSAPMTGEPLFEATLQINCPESLNSDQFEDEIAEVANELDIDISLQPSA